MKGKDWFFELILAYSLDRKTQILMYLKIEIVLLRQIRSGTREKAKTMLQYIISLAKFLDSFVLLHLTSVKIHIHLNSSGQTTQHYSDRDEPLLSAAHSNGREKALRKYIAADEM
jgi:hypothetical protein